MDAANSSRKRRSIPARIPFFYGWVILPVASLAMFASGPGQTYSFSVFIDPMREEMGWSQTTIASLYTAGSLTASAGLLIVGRLLDRFGARVMLTAVGAGLGLGALWMSRVDSNVDLYLGFGVMRLLAQGSITLISTAIVAIWFIQLRGLAMAINSLGAVISRGVFPILIFLLIANFGWRDTWVIISLLIWAMTILPAAILIRRSPESVGMLPDGRSVSAQSEKPNDMSRHPGEINLSLREATKTRAFWLLLLSTSSYPLVTTALIFNNGVMVSSHGLDSLVAASIFTTMSPTAILGAFLGGILTDKYPNRYILAAAQVLLIIPMVWSLLISSVWQALLYGSMLGLASGISITTASVIWPNYYGRRAIGSIRGAATTAMVASAALGPMPFAIILDIFKSYSAVIGVFLIIPVISIVAALSARPPTHNAAPIQYSASQG